LCISEDCIQILAFEFEKLFYVNFCEFEKLIVLFIFSMYEKEKPAKEKEIISAESLRKRDKKSVRQQEKRAKEKKRAKIKQRRTKVVRD
jgi:uncharacterized membrane protein